MAYSADTFVADEQPTTAKWNKLWTNDASFNDGTGIADDAILARHVLGLDKSNMTTDSNPYKFKAHAASNQTISDITAARMTMGTEDYDTNNNFASNQYTAPVAGFYQVNSQCRMSTTKGVSYTFEMKKNGTAINTDLESPYPSVTTYGDHTAKIIDCIQLAAADVIDWFATVDTSDSSTAAIVGAASNSNSYASMYLVCRT
jgi:hypothetical protein